MNATEFAAYIADLHFTRPIDRVQNHHTYIPNYGHFHGNNHFDLLEGMRRVHMQERKWANIGQNLTTFNDGTVAICRPLNIVPATIFMSNRGAIGIEHLGNFDLGADDMTDAHKAIIIEVNAVLCRKLGLAPATTDNIVYHHWYDLSNGVRTNGLGSTKSCPGTNFFGGNTVAAAQANFIPLVAQRLAQLSSGTAPTPPPIRPLGSGQVTATRLNVRNEPSVQGVVLRQLAKGDRVDWYASATDQRGAEWLRVHKNEAQWVARTYIGA